MKSLLLGIVGFFYRAAIFLKSLGGQPLSGARTERLLFKRLQLVSDSVFPVMNSIAP